MTFYDFIASGDTTRQKIEMLQLLSMLDEFDSLAPPELLCTKIEEHIHELLQMAQAQYKGTEWKVYKRRTGGLSSESTDTENNEK